MKSVEKENGKEKKLDRPPPRIEPASGQNKLQKNFCFSFNKRFPEDGLRKMCFFAYVISQKGSKLKGKNMQNTV